MTSQSGSAGLTEQNTTDLGIGGRAVKQQKCIPYCSGSQKSYIRAPATLGREGRGGPSSGLADDLLIVPSRGGENGIASFLLSLLARALIPSWRRHSHDPI